MRIRFFASLFVVFLFNGALLSQLPDIPDLIRVTVDHSDKGVLIQWNPSSNNDIEFYNLWKLYQESTFLLVSSFKADTLEYKHMTTGLKNLAYAVTAKDSTGNESLFSGNVHRAVDVSVVFDNIYQANRISWSGYEGWEGAISGYRIFGGLSGDTLMELRFVNSNTQQFVHTSILSDTIYKYYIETVNANSQTSLSAIDSVSTYSGSVEVESNNIYKFQFYPNPVNNILTIHSNAMETCTFELICPSGKVLQTKSLTNSLNQLDLSSYQKGVYFITIRSKDFVTTSKIIKL